MLRSECGKNILSIPRRKPDNAIKEVDRCRDKFQCLFLLATKALMCPTTRGNEREFLIFNKTYSKMICACVYIGEGGQRIYNKLSVLISRPGGRVKMNDLWKWRSFVIVSVQICHLSYYMLEFPPPVTISRILNRYFPEQILGYPASVSRIRT